MLDFVFDMDLEKCAGFCGFGKCVSFYICIGKVSSKVTKIIPLAVVAITEHIILMMIVVKFSTKIRLPGWL